MPGFIDKNASKSGPLCGMAVAQFQNAQYRSDAIHWDAMSKKAYWANFCKMDPVPNFQELLEPIDYDKAKQGDR